MARAIWDGVVSFGLVEIPVALYPAETTDDISFRQLDRRDLSPVGYRRVNKKTGEEVPWEQIVKGYEVDKDEFVVVSDEELKDANARATQTIEILGFVDAAEIDPMFYETPYYVVPLKRAGKSYSLLLETLERSGRVGIAHVVIRTRQRLAALLPRDNVLVLELLRYAHEVRKPEDLDLDAGRTKKAKASPAEVKLAERLVKDMETEWDPSRYKDEYRDDILKLVETKLKAGKAKHVEVPGRRRKKEPKDNVVDLMALLKKSVRQAQRPAARTTRRERPRRRA